MLRLNGKQSKINSAGLLTYADLQKLHYELRELSAHTTNYEEQRDLEANDRQKERSMAVYNGHAPKISVQKCDDV